MNTPDNNFALDITSVANDRQRHNPLTPDMVDSLFGMALRSGIFKKIDDGTYATALFEEMEAPLDHLKLLLEDEGSLDDATIVQTLTEAFINAQQFVTSGRTADYLESIGASKQENINDLILDDVQAVLTHLALRFGVEHIFLENIKAKGATGENNRQKTMPYGQIAYDKNGQKKPRIPLVSFKESAETEDAHMSGDTHEYPAVNIEDAIKRAERKQTQQGMPPVQMPEIKHSSSNPPQRATLPPPPMATGPVDVNVEALDTEKQALRFFKTIFLDYAQLQYLKKLRDLKKSYEEAGKTSRELNLFKDAFSAICKKAYSMVGVDEKKRAEEIAFHKYVDSSTESGESWEKIIEKLAEKIMAEKAMEVMSHYLPLVTRAFFSTESLKKNIAELDSSDTEKYEKEVNDAALKVCLFIKDQLFKPNTGEKLRDVAFLGFYFIEDREDLNLVLYNEAKKCVEQVFTEIRSKSFSIPPESSEQSVYYDPTASGEIEPIPATIRGLDSEPHQLERSMNTQIKATEADEGEAKKLLNIYDEEDTSGQSLASTPAPDVEENNEDDTDTDVFVVGGMRRIMPAAGRPTIKQVNRRLEFESDGKSLHTLSSVPKVKPFNIAISDEDSVSEEKPSTLLPKTESENVTEKEEKSWWNRVKKSKAAKIAAGVAFAATTALASYGVLTYASADRSNDATEPTAASSVSNQNNDSKPPIKIASNEKTEDMNEVKINKQTSVNKTPATEAEKLYTVHPERIAGDDPKLKKLVEEESFVRHPGNRGDFEQLHNIIAQSGALTSQQIKNIQENLNEKFNRGEYGAATKRFRPLLENGTLFEVLRTPTHPEHQALKAAIEKFGNPSRWTWTSKKPVNVNGKIKLKSMPYEEMYAQDVEFFDKCQQEFAQAGIGKNGNIHINGGKAGERIPLKINGRWLTFVETALQIRGIVEKTGAGSDVPAPPTDLLDSQPDQPNRPAHDVPTNFSPNNSGADGGTYGFFEAPTIEMGEPVLMRKADLEDDPEIKFGEATDGELDEIEMAEIDAGWDLDVGVNVGADAGVGAGADTCQNSATDNELAEIDNEWGNIVKAIDKRIEQVKRAA